MRLQRTDKSRFADWCFTVDAVLLATVLVMIAAGLFLSLAASPAVAIRRGFATYHFVEKQLLFAALGLVVMLVVSFLSPAGVRRLALAVLLPALALLVLVLIAGHEVNGARRWLSIAGQSLQPSEVAKPAFVVLSAWLLAEARRRPDMPAAVLAVALFVLFAGLLAAEPDVGQALLVSLVWCALLLLAGTPLRVVVAAAAVLGGAFAALALRLGYVEARIGRFLHAGGDSFQTDRALQSFLEGGMFGKGPGEGTIKVSLPDAHTDFIFAVIGEEYGALACLIVLALFALLLLRVFARVRTCRDPFTRLAAAGLVLLPVLEALINMGVNVGLIPAKGITLPFISSGGSSLLGACLGVGLLLALTRQGAAARPSPVLAEHLAAPARRAATGAAIAAAPLKSYLWPRSRRGAPRDRVAPARAGARA
jgi:cell division protein FtsW